MPERRTLVIRLLGKLSQVLFSRKPQQNTGLELQLDFSAVCMTQ